VGHLLLALVLTAAQPVPVRYALGTLHGFPSMSGAAGKVIANGELTQEVAADRVVVHIRWEFADGRRAEERDEFRAGRTLAQERFSWVETRGGIEQRRFEVDFSTGKATSSVRDEKGHVDRDEKQLDLPRGRSFTGYGTALAVTQLALGPGEKAEITFVAFTAKPRTVTLEARREDEEKIGVAGRLISCDRYTLHPKIPFPLDPRRGGPGRPPVALARRSSVPRTRRAEPRDEGRPAGRDRRDAARGCAPGRDSTSAARAVVSAQGARIAGERRIKPSGRRSK